MKPKDESAPSLRSGFKGPDSEALYVPVGSNYDAISAEEASVHKTVERYNLVNGFLNTLKPQEREFAQHLVIKLLPSVSADNLSELDDLLAFVHKATSVMEDDDFEAAKMTRFDVIDNFLASIGQAEEKEFAAYLAPKLLSDSVDKAEMKKVCDFL